MNITPALRFLFVFAGLMLSLGNAFAQVYDDERQIQIALRRVGHNMLLASGDSTSRVLPIEKEGDRYKLQFATEFAFDPDQLITLVDSMVLQAGIAKGYIVEMEECATKQVVHSYEVSSKIDKEDVACKGRVLPKACYNLLFTILNEDNKPYDLNMSSSITPTTNKEENQSSTYLMFGLPLLAIVLLISGFLYIRKRNTKAEQPLADEETEAPNEPEEERNEHIITIGAYRYNKHNMMLSMNNDSVELTGKESDLLLLLHTSINNTIDRDMILNAVWGDEGDYIGRTLDVFISKLRKRLEGDPNLKIVNIRGVGYKLVVDG